MTSAPTGVFSARACNISAESSNVIPENVSLFVSLQSDKMGHQKERTVTTINIPRQSARVKSVWRKRGLFWP